LLIEWIRFVLQSSVYDLSAYKSEPAGHYLIRDNRFVFVAAYGIGFARQNLLRSIMSKRVVGMGMAVFAFVFSGPVSASLQQQESQSQPLQRQEQSRPLAHGDGWRLVRSIQLGNSKNYIHMVLIDSKRDMDKAVYGAALSKICRSEPDFCRVRFWNEERHVAHAISFTDAQFKALRAEYIFNRAGQVQQMKYACTVVSDKNQCFSH
jgi:hypothetical protein